MIWGRVVIALAALAAPCWLVACAHGSGRLWGVPATSSGPGEPWLPPAVTYDRALARHADPGVAGLPDAGRSPLTLLDLAGIALRTSPDTAEAWARARAAAASLDARRAGYLPDLGASARAGAAGWIPEGAEPSSLALSASVGAELSWLLFDFGGREAALEEGAQALLAAGFAHNAAIQGVILRVAEAYLQHVSAAALLLAEEAGLREAEAGLQAAEARREAGTATIADVLQARTALSQARLAVEGLRGTIEATRGALAAVAGLPADTPLLVAAPPEDLPVEETAGTVDQAIDAALRQRPDLAAGRARAAQAAARLHQARADLLPSFSLSGSASSTWSTSVAQRGSAYAAGVGVQIPILDLPGRAAELRQAQAEIDASEAGLRGMEQEAVLQVWSSWIALRTAGQQVRTSSDLVESAAESHAVALGRYQAGVGGILDLLAAQAALAGARARRIQARADWLGALAGLAWASGSLSLGDASLESAQPSGDAAGGTP